VEAKRNTNINRRTLIAGAAVATAAAGIGVGNYWLGASKRGHRGGGKKVIILGIDGMDPRLCDRMIALGLLPNLAKMRETGGFRPLATSTPPQSPVAWANFINGAGPGDHGIFDFIHRHPEHQCAPFYSAAETVPGKGAWEIGDHKVPLNFWPFNHTLPKTVLRRQGTPFWDHLDAAGIDSTFYDLPSNYPASPSHHGHHRCLCGMGTPDMLGSYGTYQHFAENGPEPAQDESGGMRSRLSFENDTARARIVGPDDATRKTPQKTHVDILIHRDREANAAIVELDDSRIVLKSGEWSGWQKLRFALSKPSFIPAFVPAEEVGGICRFYLQEVAPNFRLYVSPINFDPTAPATPISEPASFAQGAAKRIGPFATTGFQEDYKARTNGVFGDDEYVRQTSNVLEERLTLLEYAIENYEDGLLFFYFSSGDLQSHMFWWDSDEAHPVRSGPEAKKYFGHIWKLYQKLDDVVGRLLDQYGHRATIIVMSDHGFANFGRQFNLNSWLRSWGYLGPPECTSILNNVDWTQTVAYGLGLNGLYLNMKGRERDGIVEPGELRDALLEELTQRLTAVTDLDGKPVIRGVYRSDKIYSGDAKALAPDLIVGYHRGYRASWATTLGELTDDILLDNDQPWSADHCADALEVPGILFSNRPIQSDSPSLVDLAPSILAQFKLPTPTRMVGKNVLSTP
jgi:predicted AlkP superfamily phosphohydrolase/phosphomutase